MDIVMIPFHDCKKWINEGYRTRDAHLGENFVNSEKVGKLLVVNRPVSLAEKLLKGMDWKTASGKVIEESKNFCLSRLDNGIYCIDTFVPDLVKVAIEKKNWWFTAFTYDFVKKSINKAILLLEMEKPILLLQNPMAIGAVDSVKCSQFVFDAIDNWLYHPQMANIKELVKRNYNYVDQNADMIITVSEALTKTFVKNKNIHWVSNGVDIDYFSDAFKTEKTDVRVVGYVGKIQDRVDFDLVEKCLKKFSKVLFVFLGPVYSQQKRIRGLKKKYSNIVFRGDIHYTKLPQEMKEFDIAIIPHKVDNFTNSMNPLKLYEYLSAGKQVVTTAVAGVDGISENVYLSANDDEFIENLQKALDSLESSDCKAISDSIPAEYTWKNKSELMLELMSSLQE